MKHEHLNPTKIEKILKTIISIGDGFAANFKRTSVASEMSEFMAQYNAVEQQCVDPVRVLLGDLLPGIPWANGELDLEGQRSPLKHPEYWICDSMDGAVQYLQHLPGWTINLALIQNGKPVFVVVYDPLMKEMFHALAGGGAYLNGVRIQPSLKTDSEMMLASFSHPPFVGKKRGVAGQLATRMASALQTFAALRNYGPTALQIAYVGAGRVDCFFEEGLDTYNWIPGILIAQEAGAKLLNLQRKPWVWGDESLLVCSNGLRPSLDEF